MTLDRILGHSRPQPVVTVVRDAPPRAYPSLESAVTSTFDRADEVAEEIVLAKLARRTAWWNDPWEAAMRTFGGRP